MPTPLELLALDDGLDDVVGLAVLEVPGGAEAVDRQQPKNSEEKKSASLFRASTNIGQKFSGRAPRSPAHTWRAAGITILPG